MYLKRLELLGFKSFAQKTTLEFPSGVTGIVGPNGSGKSNVIDALRWILGEREAKNIRAEKSENLIFSGTPQKTRAGFAQVTIVFDNTTNFFPVDFAEVSVRRRVGRDGTSEYFLNDSAVRLRDIIDFFAKARLGTKGVTIINQGNSDIFITASISERRMMLEEILGLRQYQIKRHEAEQKLETTNINLDKAKALVDELLPHLRLLRRQAGKWEKHDELQKELNDLEVSYFGAKLHALEAELKKIEPHIAETERDVATKEKELKALQEELQAIEKKQPQGDKHFNEFKKKQSELLSRRSVIQKELGRLEAELEFLLSRPKASVKEAELLAVVKDAKAAISAGLLADSLETVKELLKKLATKIEAVLDAGNSEAKSKQHDLEKVRKNFSEELEALEKNLAELGTMETKLAADMREFNVIFKKAFEAVEAKRREIGALENQRSRYLFDKERVETRLKDLAHEAEQAGRKLSEFTSAPHTGVDLSSSEKRLFKLRGEIASIGEIDPALITEAKQMEERYAFLSGQIDDLKKASADLKVLITQLQEKIHSEFAKALHLVNEQFNNYFRLMFGGGKAKLQLIKKSKPTLLPEAEANGDVSLESAEAEDKEFDEGGLEIEISIPRKNIKGLDMLSGGERSLVSIAVLFALISVSPPPFLVLDEIDAALDENNTKRFANLVADFAKTTQFVIVTHNRATMSSASVLYGVTMGEDGTSRVLSLKLEQAENLVAKP